MMQEALDYLKRGFSIIPVKPKGKIPLIPWSDFHTSLPTEDEVKQWFTTWPDANIGIVTGKISGLVVVDCDTDEALTWFQDRYKGTTPTVKTPKGMHFYFKYSNGIRNAARVVDGIDIRGDGGFVVAPPSIGFNNKGYIFIKDLNNALDVLDFDFLYRGSQNGNSSSSPRVTTSHKLLQQGTRDNDLFHIANCLVKGNCERGVISEVLEILAENANPPFPKSEITAKIESALERANTRERNVMSEIRQWIESQRGIITVTDYYNQSQVVTKKDKHAAVVAFGRLVGEGLLERHGNRSGTYRTVDKDIEIIDWMNATDEDYPIDLPLGLSDLVRIMPGNIIVCAGSTNTGKTSLMLEIVRLNQKKFPVVYMNSEMGPQELRLRLSLFQDVIALKDWNFKAIERSSNFVDVVEPNSLNIIDFMEIHDEFWKIGGWIKEIHDKLKKGICIIALQKKSSTKQQQQDFGRGGEITVEKPRLYLSMDRGKLKIVKAKIWRDHSRNPNGLVRQFSIINGWKFISKYDWEDPEEGGFLA